MLLQGMKESWHADTNSLGTADLEKALLLIEIKKSSVKRLTNRISWTIKEYIINCQKRYINYCWKYSSSWHDIKKDSTWHLANVVEVYYSKLRLKMVI